MTRFEKFQKMNPAQQTYYGKGIRGAGVAKMIVRLQKKAKENPQIEQQYVEELQRHCKERRIK